MIFYDLIWFFFGTLDMRKFRITFRVLQMTQVATEASD